MNDIKNKDLLAAFNRGTEFHYGKDWIYGRDPSQVGFEWDDAPKPNYYLTNTEEEDAILAAEQEDEEAEGDDEEIDTFWTAQTYQEPPPEKEEEPEWPYPERLTPPQDQAGYFNSDEKLFDKFDEVELDTFMKFLDVQPFRNWQDKAGYHHHMGLHNPEDFSQRVDPEYHMLGEVEREEFERMIFRGHRSGSTVRFTVGNKNPHFGSGRD